MKVLIAAACVCVIALTGYVIGGNYYAERNIKRQAFKAECDRIVAMNGVFTGLDQAQIRHIRSVANDCLEYMKEGYYPHERWDRR